jgi:hypothetical protein
LTRGRADPYQRPPPTTPPKLNHQPATQLAHACCDNPPESAYGEALFVRDEAPVVAVELPASTTMLEHVITIAHRCYHTDDR